MPRIFQPILICLFVFTTARSQSTSPLLDSIAKSYSQLKGFNGAVLVARKGNILLDKGYGYKDVERKTPVDENSLFQYGSITKQFTATLIMYLQEKGKLNIQDKLSKYFPGLPYGDSVTIFHLLTHTSGIYNYTNNGDFMKTEAVKPASEQKILALFRDRPLEFTPGSRFSYSNSGYSLLGYIIEKASGMSYEALMRKVILGPAGMKTAGFDFAHERSPYRTTGYNYIEGDRFEAAGIVDSSVAYSAGALYGSVKDLYAWHQALQKGSFLNATDWKTEYTPYLSKYAFGWFVDTLFGRPVLQHGGGIFGYTSMIIRFPKEDAVVIVLSNNSSPAVGDLANGLSAIVFGEQAKWPEVHKFVRLSEEQLRPLVGAYEPMPQFIVTVTTTDGKLFAEPAGHPKEELQPLSDSSFYLKNEDAVVTFIKDAAGTVTTMKVTQGNHSMEGKKVK